METVVPQAIPSQPLGGRRTARTPERARRAEPSVVDQHDQHIRRTRRRTQRLDRRERRIRVLRVIGDQARVRPVRDRQIRSRQIAAHLIHPPTANGPEARSRPSAETATLLRAPPPAAIAASPFHAEPWHLAAGDPDHPPERAGLAADPPPWASTTATSTTIPITINAGHGKQRDHHAPQCPATPATPPH